MHGPGKDDIGVNHGPRGVWGRHRVVPSRWVGRKGHLGGLPRDKRCTLGLKGRRAWTKVDMRVEAVRRQGGDPERLDMYSNFLLDVGWVA